MAGLLQLAHCVAQLGRVQASASIARVFANHGLLDLVHVCELSVARATFWHSFQLASVVLLVFQLLLVLAFWGPPQQHGKVARGGCHET